MNIARNGGMMQASSCRNASAGGVSARKVIPMGTRQKWMGMIVILAALILAIVEPGHAWRGGRGFRGSRGFGGPRIAIGIGPFWGPYWGPYTYPYAYAYPYAYPPVVVVPSTPVYVPPAPPASAPPPPPPSWYYCENPQGYYPYVQQCPRGWRPVAPGGEPRREATLSVGPSRLDPIRQAQQRLQAAGFDPGPIDGRLGARTKAALRQYQGANGLPVTGKPDDATQAALGLK